MRTPPGFRDVQADQRWVIEQPATLVANLQLSGANGTQSASLKLKMAAFGVHWALLGSTWPLLGGPKGALGGVTGTPGNGVPIKGFPNGHRTTPKWCPRATQETHLAPILNSGPVFISKTMCFTSVFFRI